LDIETRVNDLLGRMNTDEKTCQLATLYGYPKVLKDSLPTPAWKERVWKDGIANIDEHLNGFGSHAMSAPPGLHAKAINEVQRWFIEETRLGIPVDFTNEGIYGACFPGAALFPAQIGVGSSWDKDLVSKIGSITSVETKAAGFTNVYSPILDVARDPRWGRVVESYGEDPYLVSQLGLRQVLAIQRDHTVISTPKHFAAYSIPIGGRDGNTRTDPQIAPREMHTLLLQPFRVAFTKGHAHGTMASYNDYDGVPIAGSYGFLTELLRQKWGFKGYVVSDSEALEFLWSKHHVAPDYKDAVKQALEAGLDVRTTFRSPESYILPLRELVKEGSVSMELLDSRVRDVLWVKFWLGLFDKPYIDNPDESDRIYSNPEYDKVSRRASYEAMVLLRNENNFLPLDKGKIKTILIAGPNADNNKLSTSRYGPKDIKYKSVLEAFRSKLGDSINILYSKGCDIRDKNWPESEIIPSAPDAEEMAGINDAVTKAMKSDVVVMVLGEDNSIVGESKSRTDLNLAGHQQYLLDKVCETGKPVILILMNGRAITINKADRECKSIIEAWFPGKYGGEAVADIIFGDYNPGGHLPVTFPKSVGQIPMCFPFKPAAHAEASTTVNGVLYPFGFGLSFTTFEYSNLKINPQKQLAAGNIDISVDVKNNGSRKGDEVVQLYLNDEVSSVISFVKELRGFERITLEPGETRTVLFTLTPDDLEMLDRNMKWIVEPGWFRVMVGSSSEDIRQEGRFEILTTDMINKPYDSTSLKR
ncbi:MAG TPA: glycoside hydrolase family 3 N-terminal domain-containing protein, partial [Bacteroidales bacterium]|nr:glycoside hydrolase family 3 N-terminal domain-containing protein [Bacteroidales bacterium]